MHSFADIRKRSVSADELVVEYMDAMDALAIFQKRGIKVLGWEGWLLYLNGSKSHSLRYQGTADLSHLSLQAAHSLVKSTIMQARAEWKENPEVPNAELYFCITV
jgi:hypothetical protein